MELGCHIISTSKEIFKFDNIKDENNFIDASYIDGVSEIINSITDHFLDLEVKYDLQ